MACSTASPSTSQTSASMPRGRWRTRFLTTCAADRCHSKAPHSSRHPRRRCDRDRRTNRHRRIGSGSLWQNRRESCVDVVGARGRAKNGFFLDITRTENTVHTHTASAHCFRSFHLLAGTTKRFLPPASGRTQDRTLHKPPRPPSIEATVTTKRFPVGCKSTHSDHPAAPPSKPPNTFTKSSAIFPVGRKGTHSDHPPPYGISHAAAALNGPPPLARRRPPPKPPAARRRRRRPTPPDTARSASYVKRGAAGWGSQVGLPSQAEVPTRGT